MGFNLQEDNICSCIHWCKIVLYICLKNPHEFSLCHMLYVFLFVMFISIWRESQYLMFEGAVWEAAFTWALQKQEAPQDYQQTTAVNIGGCGTGNAHTALSVSTSSHQLYMKHSICWFMNTHIHTHKLWRGKDV